MPIEITSRSNPRLLGLLDDRQRLFLFEGEKLVGDLLARGTPIQKLIYTQGWLGKRGKLPASAQIGEEWLVSPEVMAKLSDLTSPPPVAAVMEPMEKHFSWKRVKWVAAFAAVQDPGNLGTIFRCASAFGWEAIALCGKCVRPNHPKLIRAAQTALLDLAIRRYPSLEELLAEAEAERFAVFLTSSHPDATTQSPKEVSEPAVLVFGSEGQGIDPDLRQRFPVVSIPQGEKVESLNVGIAACIFFYELAGRVKR